MDRALLVPAAGRGTRLASDLPKILVSVAGRPMLDHLIALYRHVVDRWILVVSPAARTAIEAHLEAASIDAEVFVQNEPTGMLDAILIPGEAGFVPPARVWITWCDQIGVDPRTVRRLIDGEAERPDLVFPTVRGPEPYIHFARDAAGMIVDVLHRREGDDMPREGESDMGLFSLSGDCYRSLLPRYARDATLGRDTGERNFLPFIPWLAGGGTVRTVGSHAPIEALGVNTPEDLAQMERHLAAGAGTAEGQAAGHAP